MKSYSFTPQGVCAKRITFAIGDDGKLHDVHFVGGCPGNLSAISKLLEGADPKDTAALLPGQRLPRPRHLVRRPARHRAERSLRQAVRQATTAD